MSNLPKRELALVGAACAVCCAPPIAGAVVAAPVLAATGGVAALSAGGLADALFDNARIGLLRCPPTASRVRMSALRAVERRGIARIEEA